MAGAGPWAPLTELAQAGATVQDFPHLPQQVVGVVRFLQDAHFKLLHGIGARRTGAVSTVEEHRQFGLQLPS